MTTPRACTGTTRKGHPCKAPPRNGEGTCISHAPKEEQEKAGFGGSQAGAGRPPLPKPTEVARALVAENIALVQRPYWRILGFDVVVGEDGRPRIVELEGGGAKLHGVSVKDGYVFMSDHDDLGAMLTAAEKLQDRAFGKPKQISEVSGPQGGPIVTEGTVVPGAGYLGEDVQEAAARLLDQAGKARARELGAGNE